MLLEGGEAPAQGKHQGLSGDVNGGGASTRPGPHEPATVWLMKREQSGMLPPSLCVTGGLFYARWTSATDQAGQKKSECRQALFRRHNMNCVGPRCGG